MRARNPLLRPAEADVSPVNDIANPTRPEALTRRRLVFGAGAAFAASALPTWAVGPDINQQGLTGMWFEPASYGQGLALEVYADLAAPGTGYLQGGWFTFDKSPAGGVDKQRWYTFGGLVPGGTSTGLMTLFRSSPGNFASGPETAAVAVGNATIQFSSCTAGTFNYQFNDGSGRSGIIPLTRLTGNVTCSTTSSRPTDADFALSGNWYNKLTPGQGFIIEINPKVAVGFFCWYTYSADGPNVGGERLRWFTGQGAYQTGARSLFVTLYETTGGVFDTDTTASQATQAVGQANINFVTCSSATITYNFFGGSNAGRQGGFTLTRVSKVPEGCTA